MLTKSAPSFLTRAEVASLLRVSAQTLMIWVSKGRFPPPVRLGRRALWDPATVEKALVAKGLVGEAGEASL